MRRFAPAPFPMSRSAMAFCLFAFFAPILWTPVAASADTYAIDKEHTEVRFTWDHVGLSRQSGRLVDVTGTLEFDETRPEMSKVRAEMPLAGLWTGVPKLDQLIIRSKDYFDADRFPTITFESTAVRMTGARTAEITGDLIMNGATRPVILAATWNYAGEHPLVKINPAFAGQHVAGFSARGVIRRSDWGITRFAPFVSDEIQISIEAELQRTAISAPLPLDPLDGKAADAQGVEPLRPPE